MPAPESLRQASPVAPSRSLEDPPASPFRSGRRMQPLTTARSEPDLTLITPGGSLVPSRASNASSGTHGETRLASGSTQPQAAAFRNTIQVDLLQHLHILQSQVTRLSVGMEESFKSLHSQHEEHHSELLHSIGERCAQASSGDRGELVREITEMSETFLEETVVRFRNVVDSELTRHLFNLGFVQPPPIRFEESREEHERNPHPGRKHTQTRRDEAATSGAHSALHVAVLSSNQESVNLPSNSGISFEEPKLEPSRSEELKFESSRGKALRKAETPQSKADPTQPEQTIARPHLSRGWSDQLAAEEELVDKVKKETLSWIKVQDSLLEGWISRARGQGINESGCGILSRCPMANETPDSRLWRLVHSTWFNGLSSLLILANGAWMGFETHCGLINTIARQSNPEWFYQVEASFVSAFMLELIITIAAKRGSFFCGKMMLWNLCDACLIVASFLHVLTSKYVSINMSCMMVMRAFRVIRAARIVRGLRFFHELRFMVCSIVSSLSTMVWSLVLILMVVFVFSIFFMQCAIFHLEHDVGPGADNEDLVQTYGTLWKTMWSLLLAISGGADWGDIVQPMWEIHWTYSLVFLLYIFFVVIGVLNVLVGVFVNAATENLDRDLVIQSEVMRKNQFVEEMTELFSDISNKKGPGTITWDEFRNHLDNHRVQAYLSLHQLDSTDAFMLFSLIDRDKSNRVDLTEFIQGCLHLKGEARCSDVAFLMEETRQVRHDLLLFQKELKRNLNVIISVMQGHTPPERVSTL